MLTVLVTLWASSLVVLAVLLGAVIVGQAAWTGLRRLSGSWTRRAERPLAVARTSVRA